MTGFQRRLTLGGIIAQGILAATGLAGAAEKAADHTYRGCYQFRTATST